MPSRPTLIGFIVLRFFPGSCGRLQQPVLAEHFFYSSYGLTGARFIFDQRETHAVVAVFAEADARGYGHLSLQQHFLGEGKLLRRLLKADRLTSVIFYGPPGTGKTTLARLLAGESRRKFRQLNAVTSGVKELREVLEAARDDVATGGSRTLLFVDEIHRFNKSQQDALLPHVESGLFVFVGATTENPSFEVNSALLSRAAVYVLASLTEDELRELLGRALASPTAPELHDIAFDDAAATLLVRSSDGDGRKLLNNLEIVVRALPRNAPLVAGKRCIDEAIMARALAENLRRFDKGGEAFYDSISALHKSVRGSDPDASLYWFCRMLDGGTDPRYLARRMIRMASEDIGLADPRALQLTLNAADVYERLGSPEGELALAQALVYLAVAPKSNAVYMAYNAAREFVKHDGSRPIPIHLRNAPTKLMKELGYGREYRYAHDEPEAYAAGEQYLPDGITDAQFYTPTGRGLEGKIADKLAHLRELDRKAGKD